MFFNKKKKSIKKLLDRYSTLVTKEDLDNCLELYSNGEYHLCYDTFITQVYEYDLEISREDYLFFEDIGKILSIEPENYEMLTELIRENGIIPKPVKDNIGKIIQIIKKEGNGVN